MLKSLAITNMLLIEKAEIIFSDGLNVFTGETGAGKSIILDCLGFVLGQKIRKRFLKEHSKSGQVIAEFIIDKSSNLLSVIKDLSIPISDTLIIRRVEFLDGRKKSYINDTACSLELIQDIGSKLIEFVDQKNNSNILKKQNHINLLDDFCGNKKILIKLKEIWGDLKNKKKTLLELISKQDQLTKEYEFIKDSIIELKSLDLSCGEFEELENKQKSLKSATKIKQNLKDTYLIVTQAEITRAISDSINKLEKTSELLKNETLLEETISLLTIIINNLDEIEKNIPTLIEKIFTESINLEDVEERLFTIKNLSRKHKVFPENLILLQEKMEKQIDEFNSFDKEIIDLKNDIILSEEEYDKIAEQISFKRKSEGKKLSININRELSPLKMDGLRFVTLVEDKKDKSITGKDKVIFQLRNYKMALHDLEGLASGGELSRILLALKVSLAKNSSNLTLIFDEVDRGIGGATAEAVGNRLSILSKKEQILLVTHSPQVASKAKKHWKVTKIITNEGIPKTFLEVLEKNDSKQELARMISGKTITKEAIAAAKKLMN